MIAIEWEDVPELAREAVAARLRAGRDQFLGKLKVRNHAGVEGAWRNVEVVAAIYNAALVRLGARP